MTSASSTRMNALRDAMNTHGLDVLLVTSVANVRYLTGTELMPYSRFAGLLVGAYGAEAFVVPGLDRALVARNAAGIPVHGYDDLGGPGPALRDALRAVAPAAAVVAVEKRSITALWAETFGTAAGRLDLRDGSGLVHELRARKDAEELDALAAASRLADDRLPTIGSLVAPGRTECEVAHDLARALHDAGSERLPFDPVILAGPNTAFPHRDPGDRVIREDDLVQADWGARSGGYCSDTARVLVAGTPSDTMREVHAVVLAAQDAAIAAMGPGVPTGAVDEAARSVIVAAGYGEHFLHRTGHGLGLEFHEAPQLVAGGTDHLHPGMVTTVEPGIYLPGRFGIRLEVQVAVTEDGARVLSTAPRDLVVCGTAEVV